MLLGYARISTLEQSLDLQLDALKLAGCEKIYSDRISGSKSERPGLTEVLSYAREGDVIVVWKLDRLGRSLGNLIDIVQGLTDRGIEFKSLQENLDTTTPGGKLLFHIFGSIAEFERDLIRERTLAGLTAARSRGRVGGAPNVLTQQQIDMGKQLASNRTYKIKDICKMLNCSTATYYRHIHNNND